MNMRDLVNRAEYRRAYDDRNWSESKRISQTRQEVVPIRPKIEHLPVVWLSFQYQNDCSVDVE